MKEPKSPALWVLSTCLRYNAQYLLLVTIAGIILATLPGLNVLAIKYFSSHPATAVSDNAAGFFSGSVMPPLVIIFAVLIAATNVITQSSYALSRIMVARFDIAITRDFGNSLTNPDSAHSQIRDISLLIFSAREAIDNGYPGAMLQALLQTFFGCITAVFLGFSLWSISPTAAILAVFAALPTALSYTVVGRLEAKTWDPISYHKRRSNYLLDHLTYLSFLEELTKLREAEKISSFSLESRRISARHREKLEVRSMGIYLLFSLATLLLSAWSIYSIWASEQDMVLVLSGVVGIMSGISALSGLGYQIGEFAHTRPGIKSLMALKKAANLRFPALQKDQQSGDIVLEDVTVYYPEAETPAVSHASFRARCGEITALVGANGAGKTTIFSVILGNIPFRGQIRVPASFPGIITQDFGRYELSVKDFVSLGKPETSEEEIINALHEARCWGFVSALPQGINTQLGHQWKGGHDLSGGQWQRLALARLFLHDDSYWLLDEPTSAVDADAELKIFRTLQQHKNNKAIVVVSHRLSTLLLVDKVVVLKEGRIIESGNPHHLLHSPSYFASLFRGQQISPHKPQEK
ncbi:ATP-binding cassette domain-containing protein [Corynebacterium sp. 3HC-13]|uniref:ATP-binding cassette domain-containing protein n=1 Tax=Corynebacterium poyangense TaxID=2684405 RepID=UPI001CCC663D|nr:ABC transporter ATP-binding protein [Corynebacterium poyangense]MBZ8177493.1 ATP-binding cassette domain-containing protein [Corynebacterium poyangense]